MFFCVGGRFVIFCVRGNAEGLQRRGIAQGLHRDCTGIAQEFHRNFTGIYKNLQEFHRNFTGISPGFHRDFTGFHRNFTGISQGFQNVFAAPCFCTCALSSSHFFAYVSAVGHWHKKIHCDERVCRSTHFYVATAKKAGLSLLHVYFTVYAVASSCFTGERLNGARVVRTTLGATIQLRFWRTWVLLRMGPPPPIEAQMSLSFHVRPHTNRVSKKNTFFCSLGEIVQLHQTSEKTVSTKRDIFSIFLHKSMHWEIRCR